MKLNKKQLAALGIALYGEHWKTALANLVSVSERTMRRNASNGGMEITGEQYVKIKAAIHHRMDLLTDQLEAFDRWG